MSCDYAAWLDKYCLWRLNKRVFLILGASGMLGSSLMTELIRSGMPRIFTPSHQELDITNEEAVHKYFQDYKPQYVINCAGARDIDWCEKNEHEAFRLNASGAKYVAEAAKAINAKLVHISTDYVFDGSKRSAYVETDSTNPLQKYGQSNLFGEQAVIKNGGIVARVQWLYGPSKNNFIDWICRSIKSDQKIRIATQQTGSPSSTEWVSKIVLMVLLYLDAGEIYHIAHDNFCTRWESSYFIANYFGKDPEQCFEKIDGIALGTAARPLNTSLSNQKIIQALGMKSFGSWKDDLGSYLSKHYRK